MKKAIFISICIILFLCFLLIINFGFKLGPIKFLSYDEIAEANINKKILLEEYDEKIDNEYKRRESELRNVSAEYKTLKNEYETRVNNGSINPSSVKQSLNIFDFNEICDIAQEYAKEKNVEMNFNIKNSDTDVAIFPECVICDISFEIKGEYIDITDYIYSLEDDDRLNFEIKDFELKKMEDVLKASFVVKSVPISSDSIN